MELSPTIDSLCKPIPLVFSSFTFNYNSFYSIAGSDINIDSQVYLLYEMPINLLARRFFDNQNAESKFKILIHELNGCIVGPGLYQEWTNYIYAAKSRNEQNLELCRSLSNNMLYYRAIKPIRKGDQLLAWFSPSVEVELTKSLLNRDFICPSGQSLKDDSQCKRCLIDFEQPNILKSHLLFDLCGKSIYTNYLDCKIKPTNSSNLYKSTSTTPPSSLSSSSSTTSSCSSYSNTNLNIRNTKLTQIQSAFSPILVKKNETQIDAQKIENISSRSSSPISITFSPNSKSKRYIDTNDCKKLSIKKFKTTLDDDDDEIEKHTEIDIDIESNELKKYSVKKEQEKQQLQEQICKNGIDWKITMLDGTQTVELNMADEMGKQKKTHVCLFCGKIYNRKYGLKIHLRTHTGYKPLKCKVCSRPFSDPSNLNKHVRLHSQGDTPYKCPYCGKILVRKRDLDRHIISRHSGNNDNVKLDDDDDDEEESSNSNNDDLNDFNNNISINNGNQWRLMSFNEANIR